MYSFLADMVALVHAAYILFVIVGQLLILVGWVAVWGWTRNMVFRLLHLLAIGFVVVEAWTGVVCPLTVLESRLRVMAGSLPYDAGFLSYWLNWLIYYTAPEWVFTLVYSVFALIVLITFVVYPPQRAARSH